MYVVRKAAKACRDRFKIINEAKCRGYRRVHGVHCYVAAQGPSWHAHPHGSTISPQSRGRTPPPRPVRAPGPSGLATTGGPQTNAALMRASRVGLLVSYKTRHPLVFSQPRAQHFARTRSPPRERLGPLAPRPTGSSVHPRADRAGPDARGAPLLISLSLSRFSRQRTKRDTTGRRPPPPPGSVLAPPSPPFPVLLHSIPQVR